MKVKRTIPHRDVVAAYQFSGRRGPRALVDSVVREMGPCAELVELDGQALLREEWSDDYALWFDVPDDPRGLLL